MTHISLISTILPQQVIDSILSRCPALTRLELHRCRGFQRLEIGGRRFRSLNVQSHDDGSLLEVSAPYMTHLYYGGDIEARTLRLTNVVSPLRLELNLFVFKRDPASLITNAYQIFRTIGCADTLFVRKDHTLELLSTMATNLPQFKLKHLTICSNVEVVETDGTIALLQSSPFLETFTMYGHQSNKVFDATRRRNLNCDLLHLKTVKFKLVRVDEDDCSKSILAWAHTLLERAPNLKEMYIYKIKSSFAAEKDFIKALSSYPKFSENARIVIS